MNESDDPDLKGDAVGDDAETESCDDDETNDEADEDDRDVKR